MAPVLLPLFEHSLEQNLQASIVLLAFPLTTKSIFFLDFKKSFPQYSHSSFSLSPCRAEDISSSVYFIFMTVNSHERTQRTKVRIKTLRSTRLDLNQYVRSSKDRRMARFPARIDKCHLHHSRRVDATKVGRNGRKPL